MRRPSSGGFTLLEVMIAMGILAMAFVAIGTTTSTSVVGSAKVYRMTTAALLLRGIVLDIEEEYKIEGFPTNDLTGRDCDLPSPFDRDFQCEYDLEGMLFEEGQLEMVAQEALAQLTGGQDPMQYMQSLKQQGGRGGAEGGLPGMEAVQSQFSSFSALAMLMTPEGQQLGEICGVNLAGIIMGVVGVTQFFPVIVQKAAEQTRKLTVRLTWKEGRRKDRKLEIETFIVVTPEEQDELMKALGRAEEGGMLDGQALPGDGRGGQPAQPAQPAGGGR